AAAIALPRSDAASIAAFFFFWLVFAVIGVALHESGHALAAKLVGFHVFRVTLGRGRELWSGRVAGIPVSVHEAPLSGRIYAAPASARGVGPRVAGLVL